MHNILLLIISIIGLTEGAHRSINNDDFDSISPAVFSSDEFNDVIVRPSNRTSAVQSPGVSRDNLQPITSHSPASIIPMMPRLPRRPSQSFANWEPVDENTLYNRLAFIKEHLEDLKLEAENFKSASSICRSCGISWAIVGTTAAASSVVVSSLGIANVILPEQANAISVGLSTFSAVCFWGSSRAQTAAKKYHDILILILRKLGIPDTLLPPNPQFAIAANDMRSRNNSGNSR